MAVQMTQTAREGSRAGLAPFALPAVARVVAGVALMALAAQVRFPVPGTEVPATLQSLAMILLALTLRPGETGAVMLAYLAVGIAGLPVFSGGSAGLSGSTGGFLVGFAVAAPLISLWAGRTARVGRMIFAALAGLVLLFALGNLWRWGFWSLVQGKQVGVAAVLATGFLPFAPKAIAEAVFAATLVGFWRKRRSPTG
jgi:biotin transport system substrate-specific component